MKLEDVLTLAKAGFTATQIGALAQSIDNNAPAPAPAQQNNDAVLEQLKILTGAIQTGNLGQASQPKPMTTDDIIANIINPPIQKGE